MRGGVSLKTIRRNASRVRVRLTKIGRKAGRRVRTPRRSLTGKVRRLPLPAALRAGLYRFVPWRPWTVSVSVDKLLLGAQNRLSAAEFSEGIHDLLWASTPIGLGPHAAVLRAAAANPGLTDEQILAGPYGRFGSSVVALTGNFFSAKDDAGLVGVARDYLRQFAEPGSAAEPAHNSVGRSRHGTAIRATPIRHSDCYQIIDGHHRAAILTVRGDASVRVRPSWLSLTTPLQDLLDDMTWVDGQRELYQPLDAPELCQSWPVVRKCVDRMDKMRTFLASVDLPEKASYVDVASCYGWFVSHMSDLGLDAHGIERDPLVRPLGEACYGVDPVRIEIGDAVDVLSRPNVGWDVVSCLSLLHHFALGRAQINERAFIQLLDGATRRVLFLDTGESHEEWLSRRLPGWEPADVREFLVRETSFDEVFDLGPDEDAVSPYQENYGRHLFACVRRG